MPTISVAGWALSSKTPGFYGRVISPSGKASAAGFLLTVLLVGGKASGGTITADTEVADCFAEEDADTKGGAGSELACMAYDALKIPGVRLKLASPTAAGGAVAATFTITVTVTTAAVGTYRFRIAGKTYEVIFSASDTVSTAATKIKNAINADAKCPFSANSTLGVVTATCKTAGIRGNQHYIAQDTSGLPSGSFACALAGGTAVTGGIVPASGGTGTEDVTALTTTLTPGWYDFIVSAPNDVTNLGRWKAYMQAKSAPQEMRNEQLIVGTNGTLSAATTVSTDTTNVNFTQMCHLWDQYGETHPSRNAAQFAAIRSVLEQANPSQRYMNVVLPASAPHSQIADVPSNAVSDSALNNGVSPVSTINGNKVVQRAVTTYSLIAANTNDYRCLDVANVSMSFYALRTFKADWDQDFSVNYDYCVDNPDPNSATPVPDRALYPDLWNAHMYDRAKEWEKRGWVYDVDNHKPSTIFDSGRKALVFDFPCYATPGLYQIGGNVRQVAA